MALVHIHIFICKYVCTVMYLCICGMSAQFADLRFSIKSESSSRQKKNHCLHKKNAKFVEREEGIRVFTRSIIHKCCFVRVHAFYKCNCIFFAINKRYPIILPRKLVWIIVNIWLQPPVERMHRALTHFLLFLHILDGVFYLLLTNVFMPVL